MGGNMWKSKSVQFAHTEKSMEAVRLILILTILNMTSVPSMLSLPSYNRYKSIYICLALYFEDEKVERADVSILQDCLFLQ